MFGFGEKVPQMAPDEVQAQLGQASTLYIVDVRTIGEFRSGHIPGAKLIPLGELANRLSEIPKNQPVVTVCRSGSRSLSAARQLKKAGYDVYNMTGGMMRWSGKTVR